MGTSAWARTRRRQARLAALLLTFGAAASAQTVDTSTAHIVIGEPVSLVIRVRAFDLPATQIRPECVSLRLQQGDSGFAIAPLQLQITPGGDDSSALVRATSPEVVTDPFVTGRLVLSCGAEFVREFTVLSDPPRAAAGGWRRAASTSAQPSAHARKHPVTAAPKPSTLGATPHAGAPVSAPPASAPSPSPAPLPGSSPASAPTTRAAPTPRSVTRAEGPPAASSSSPTLSTPAAAAASADATPTGKDASPGATPPETDVQTLARAVLQVLQAQGHGASLTGVAAAAGTAASSPAEMLLPWQELREEQRLTRATLAALQARLERAERDVWRDALVVMAVIVGLAMSMLLARVAREWALPRIMSLSGSTGPDDPAASRHSRRRWGDGDDFSDPALASTPPSTLSTPSAPSTPSVPQSTTAAAHTAHTTQTAPDMTIHWSPSLSGAGRTAPVPDTPDDDPFRITSAVGSAAGESQWPDADFGRPSLGDSLASIELLQELDAHTDSCPVGCVVVLESRLQENSGKCPWILLRLLDLYQQLEQPWNRVRVAAQLETLYNVRLDADVSAHDAAVTADDLAAGPGTMAEVQRAWGLEDPLPALHALLLRPTLVEVLSRAAFEEVLLLLTVAQRRSTVDSGSPATTPESKTAPGQPEPLELLAA